MTSTSHALDKLASIGLNPVGHGPMDPDRQASEGAPAVAFADIVRVVNASTVIEVGSWEGRSAIVWGNCLSQQSSTWLIVCIDTWLGSTEMWFRDAGDWSRAKLHLTDGFPSVYSTFASTVRRAGYEQQTVALPIDSSQGIGILNELGITADIVYVDAAHDFENALRDMRAARLLLDPDNSRALILCDDFMPLWAGVREAVFVSAQETGARVMVKGSQAALVPISAQPSMVDELVQLGWAEARPVVEVNPTIGEDNSIARLTQELRAAYESVGVARSTIRVQREENRNLRKSRNELRQRIKDLRASPRMASVRRDDELARVQEELANVLRSRSWRMTAWIRRLRALRIRQNR